MLSISQSLIKRYWEYQNQEACGHAILNIDILKKYESKPTERMQAGSWFEFLCTGAINRDGTTPEPVTTKSGLSAESKRAQIQAERFKMLMEQEKFEILEVGKILEVEYPDHGFKLKGVLDVFGMYEGKKSILDIKNSGLIGDEWKDMGWHAGTFNMRKKLTLQVVFYKYLAWKQLGIRDIPFYFAVHSSTNEYDSLFWEIELTDFDVAMSHFEDMILETVPDIKLNVDFGFTPYPAVKRCAECPLEKDCEHKIVVPKKEVITIDGIFV